VLSAGENALVGALAGGVGSLVSNPMDVVMTRINLSEAAGGAVSSVSSSAALGVWGTLCSIALGEEGPTALFKGAAPRLAHKMPANAIFFLCYEFFRRVLRVQPTGGVA